MKKIIRYFVAIAMAAVIFVVGFSLKATAQYPNNDPNQGQQMPPPAQMDQDGDGMGNQPITYQTFYDDLAPYGVWIEYPGYGHVWHPGIAGDFRPYLTNGNWEYSTEGWIWNSNYNWGWAPFHYGRWIYDNNYGWLWIPGYDWSPAWVQWGNFDNYYGWAPLMPEVNVGVAFGAYRPAAFYWNFVSRDHIYDRDIYNHVMDRERVNRFSDRVNILNDFGHTNVHNHFYSRGPEINDVERGMNRRIQPVQIRDVNRNYMNRSDNNMRPSDRRSNDNGRRFDNNDRRQNENNIQVYRPTVVHPQPTQFRRIDNSTVSPVRTNQDRVAPQPQVQQQNVNRLPVRNAPASTFPRGGATNNNNNNRGAAPARRGDRRD